MLRYIRDSAPPDMPQVPPPACPDASAPITMFSSSTLIRDVCLSLRDTRFFRIYHIIIVNSVCCSHAMVSGPTSKRPASDGGLVYVVCI